MNKKKKYIFEENDYKSNDGMQPLIWGSSMWHILNCISFNYPENPTKKQKKDYYKFFSSIKNVLPCSYCRINMKLHLKELPLDEQVFSSRTTLSKWVYKMHECVNNILKKKSNITYKQFRDTYENFRSRCIVNPNTNKTDPGCEDIQNTKYSGFKGKCVLNIVPKEDKCKTLNIDKKCILTKNKIRYVPLNM